MQQSRRADGGARPGARRLASREPMQLAVERREERITRRCRRRRRRARRIAGRRRRGLGRGFHREDCARARRGQGRPPRWAATAATPLSERRRRLARGAGDALERLGRHRQRRVRERRAGVGRLADRRRCRFGQRRVPLPGVSPRLLATSARGRGGAAMPAASVGLASARWTTASPGWRSLSATPAVTAAAAVAMTRVTSRRRPRPVSDAGDGAFMTFLLIAETLTTLSGRRRGRRAPAP